jgi:RTX calcium-binding nonapeptide repeat (4 copies)
MPRRRSLVLAALTTFALLASPSVAAPAQRIVVYGAASGSHLRLSTRGPSIVVHGLMAHAHPRGCRFTRGRRVAVCRARGSRAIEIDMGRSGDLVEVLDRMPFPLTAHLGAGEDKFIGNGERDLCYSEGTRRNRCIGGGGNDVCITGSRNSDCVGGPGNDYCKARSGSDGCWGGSGNDVCRMGSGEDGCHGEGGNDRLFGEHDPDQLYGGRGFDYCDGGLGVGYSHQCEAGPRH